MSIQIRQHKIGENLEGLFIMPSVSLCMIVRNEESSLSACLKSVSDAVDEIIIVDTGSTDRTLEVAGHYGARCYSVDWEHDFAKARNVSLSHATKDFILVLDADELWLPESSSALRQALLAHPDAGGFFVHVCNQTDADELEEIEVSLNVRLFRNQPEYRFSGALHEQIAETILTGPRAGIIVDSQVKILHLGYMQRAVEEKQKKQRNLEIALREFEAHPGDGFRAFNLGVEYVRLKDWEKAIEAFEWANNWRAQKALWVPRFFKIFISALMQCGKWEQAQRILDEGLDMFPDYTDLHYLQGVAHYQRQEWVYGLRCYARCIEMGDPPIPPYSVERGISSYRAYFAMGQVYQIIGKTAEAVVAYREAFQLNPQFAQSYLRFAALLLKESAGSDTVDYLAMIAESAGEDSAALVGMALAAAHHFTRARERLESAANPERVAEHLALTYACLDEPQKLRELFAQYDRDGALRTRIQGYLLDQGLQIVRDGLERFPDSTVLLEIKSEYEKWIS